MGAPDRAAPLVGGTKQRERGSGWSWASACEQAERADQAGEICAGWAARAVCIGQGGLWVWAGSGHARERLAGRAEVGLGGSWAFLLEVS